MKFARYLEETQVPEWKKAYIDYRGLKKRITACRKEKERANGKRPASPRLDELSVTTRSQASTSNLQPDHTSSAHDVEDQISVISDRDKSPPVHQEYFSPINPPPAAVPHHRLSADGQRASSSRSPSVTPSLGRRTAHFSPPVLSPSPHPAATEVDEDGLNRANTLNMGMLPRLRRRSTFRLPTSLRRGGDGRWELNGEPKLPWDPTKPVSLADLMPLLTSTQRTFFDKLDSELDKVESFYVERERETAAKTHALKKQLQELQAHRQQYHQAHQGNSWIPSLIRPSVRFTDNYNPEDPSQKSRQGSPRPSISSRTELPKIKEPETSGSSDPDSPTSRQSPGDAGNTSGGGRTLGKKIRQSFQRHPPVLKALTAKYDPEEYYQAKKKLKKAVLECYRRPHSGLEILDNYRTLNIIGFRKALKKFEKVTRIPAMQAYTTERIEPNAFTSGRAVEVMMRDLEELFAARFTKRLSSQLAKGDKKKALARLRGGIQHRSHHFSTFRSGLMIGLAVPAFIDGLVESFKKDTREDMPAWDGLLYIYAILFVPVFFVLLIGVNLQVWAASRINYRIGEETVTPTIWPLLWLALVGVVMFNPFPIWFKRSRYWLIGNVSKLLISGTQRVEFADFWMGDQFCSLIFTLSNLYFIPCSLPLLSRAIQSLRRYHDSKLFTHLINGGKYATGIVYYLSYYIWRNHGGGRGKSFVVWIVFATCYSIYAGSWDLLMDWSLLRPHVPRYPLLRPNILYTNAVPVYYFAIITNVLLRFLWVLYIPEQGPNFLLRTFIVAMLEALRRWQWNFFRLENEHLGNVDQYRVTREVPLPYAIDAGDDSDDEDDRRSRRSRSKSVGSSKASSTLRWRRGRANTVTSRRDDNSEQLSSD
ncbi:EXS family protein/ERD1/XPR1/SYG1 family protein [Cristinia sonorae]|uniref:EXS family protein/ERD1/XPR1/SYG1 family protein n=1 Tax=Cristinia sonorae TaxID=1940300 RepID=A0A8K0UF71_9AGAR|nr:EXS family protein/ERD1/XPR1/SYG1 family protein [Cristinia sonorae]